MPGISVPTYATIVYSLVVYGLTFLTNHSRHLIEGKTLIALDSEALVVMLPRGKNEQTPFGAGIKARTSGVGEVGETIFL